MASKFWLLRARGPRGILCTRGEKEQTSKRVSIIVYDNVISKPRFATRTRLRTNPSRTLFGVPTRYCVLVGLNSIKILTFRVVCIYQILGFQRGFLSLFWLLMRTIFKYPSGCFFIWFYPDEVLNVIASAAWQTPGKETIFLLNNPIGKQLKAR